MQDSVNVEFNKPMNTPLQFKNCGELFNFSE